MNSTLGHFIGSGVTRAAAGLFAAAFLFAQEPADVPPPPDASQQQAPAPGKWRRVGEPLPATRQQANAPDVGDPAAEPVDPQNPPEEANRPPENEPSNYVLPSHL
ncbi:MAG TPA: hypothetical protein VG672_18355, partial [Bryobacteraceae bacterium]|nr:hypothetical protein [Bryobacteraceae bacterium]